MEMKYKFTTPAIEDPAPLIDWLWDNMGNRKKDWNIDMPLSYHTQYFFKNAEDAMWFWMVWN